MFLGFGNTASASEYPDVNPGDWYYEYVQDVSNKGLMSGCFAGYSVSSKQNQTGTEQVRVGTQQVAVGSHDEFIGYVCSECGAAKQALQGEIGKSRPRLKKFGNLG